MTTAPKTRAAVSACVLLLAVGGGFVPQAAAQVERVYHPMYLPAHHNWEFRTQFPTMDRLFNAFDYGHGILYETLWARPDAPVDLLEEEIYRDLTQRILPNPPRLPMPEASFMPRYARLVPLAKEMFEWAHILHKQSYDILADRRLSEEERDRAMAELLEYYLSSELAFPDVPKGMEVMDEQYFSKAFRERYPKFNGLIWAYHWLQVAAYEPLLVYDDPERQRAAMDALLARFWQMLEDPPEALPSEMPMTPAIAPAFTERYPGFAAVFDNLHMMHDVISDILVSGEVVRGEKRAEIYRQADLFRDPGAMAVSRDDWIAMALAHGLDAQGGPAVGWLPEVPTRGAAPHAHPDHHDHRDHPEEPGPRVEAHHHGDHHGHETADPHTDHGGPEAAIDRVREIVTAFHDALAAGTEEAALALLHPDVWIYEQGHAETLEEYRAGHLSMDMAFAQEVEREVIRDEVVAVQGGALYLAEIRNRGTFRDREVDTSGVETAFLVETPEGWRIRHFHWSSRR
jgi:hypothetical protein